MTGHVRGRRHVLRAGGAALAGTMVLSACGQEDPEAVPVTGPRDQAPSDTHIDIVMANTAISLELLAIQTYDVAERSGLLEDPAVTGAAALFRVHHEAHRDALAAIVEARGGTPVDAPNALAKSALVDPALAGARSGADVLQVIHDLERTAAQVYVYGVGELTTPELRSAVMTIGGIEARHAAVLGTLATFEPAMVFPTAFAAATNPLPEGALITAG